MSNLIQQFPPTNKLVAVIATAKSSRTVYTARFEDGEEAYIRGSNRRYVSVTQCATGDNCSEFIFSSKAAPALASYQTGRFVTTVQVTYA